MLRSYGLFGLVSLLLTFNCKGTKHLLKYASVLWKVYPCFLAVIILLQRNKTLLKNASLLGAVCPCFLAVTILLQRNKTFIKHFFCFYGLFYIISCCYNLTAKEHNMTWNMLRFYGQFVLVIVLKTIALKQAR